MKKALKQQTDNVTEPAGKNLMKNWRDTVSCMILLVTFLLPLKFGTLTGLPEATSYFPEGVFPWLIISWPAMLFPLVAGILLLLTLTAFPFKETTLKNPAFVTAGLWVLLALVAALGIINASTWDFVIMELTHLSGIAAYSISIYLLLANRPEMKKWLFGTILAAVALTAYLGLEQMFSGFEETRKFVANRESANGIATQGGLKARLMDDRVFGSFSSSNSLAGYLLLASPLSLVFLWRLCGRIDPPKIARALFMPLLIIAIGMVFAATKGRAAYLSLIIGIGVFIAVFPVDKRIRWAVLLGGALAVVAGAVFIYYRGRGFHSMEVRVDYILSSLKMLVKDPLCGSGWGDFFHDHMTLKTVASEEAAHTPHNIIMAFAGQTGILGLMAALAALFYPLRMGARKIYRDLSSNGLYLSTDAAIFFGFTAFAFHSLMDVDLQIPALMSTAAALTVALLTPDVRPEKPQNTATGRAPTYLVALVVMAAALVGGWHMLTSEYVFNDLVEICNWRNKKPAEFMRITPMEVTDKLKAAIEARPYSPFPWLTAGDFMMGRQQIDTAGDFYRKALELSPERSMIYHRLYIIYSLQGKDDEARKKLKKARELFPHNEKYRTLPPMLKNIGKKPQYGPLKQ